MMDWLPPYYSNPTPLVPKWSKPDSFCRFMCGFITPGSPESAFLKRRMSVSNFASQVAPRGLWCARGLNALPEPIRSREDVQKILAREHLLGWGRGPRAYESYSLNVSMAVVEFAIGYYIDHHFRGASLKKGYGILGSPRNPSEGLLIVAQVLPQDIKSWGVDSESGLLHEAEIHVKRCEPRCIRSVYLCSKDKRLPFKKATKTDRTTYALDEHVEVKFKEGNYKNLLILNPSCTKCDAPEVTSIKRVRHTPRGYDWYRVL